MDNVFLQFRDEDPNSLILFLSLCSLVYFLFYFPHTHNFFFVIIFFIIEKLDARGIQLAALFMSGVDTALFANDACGQPVPWEHCCPWIYFDGKLFQSKLIKAGRERVSLVELCDGQADLATKVEKMRQSILEGINMNHPPPSALLPSPTFVPPMVPSLYPVSLYSRAMGSMPLPPQGRSRGFAGLHPIPPQGGKLEIAGMVVGQWAGSRSSRGRGSFGMQVVSVGGPGKGHGKEQTGRGSKGHKKGNKQMTKVRENKGW
ncbi:hypothetical protein H8959_008762 [Pygathrix nigripes]